MPDHGQLVLLLLEDALDPLAPLDDFNLQPDIDLAQHVRDHLTGPFGIAVDGRQLDGGIEPVRIAGLGQQRLGFFRIVGKLLGQIHIIGG